MGIENDTHLVRGCQSELPALKKIGAGEIIFVRGQGAKAEHTLAYVSISLSADSCKKNSSEPFLPKIAYDEIIFVRGQATKPQHSKPM